MKAIIRYCKVCNTEYTGHKSKIYCSVECRKIGKPPIWNKGKTGLPANRPRNGKEKTCKICGKSFYVSKVRLNAHYCSHECYLKERWGNSHRVTIVCVICGKEFEDYALTNRKVCSDLCKRENLSRMQQGEKCRFWRGGKMAPYVGEWKTQRRAARERDGHKCVLCGSTDRIQVHHIIPYRYSQSHNLDNLVTLCRSCHSREELKVNPLYAQTLIEGRSIRLAFLAERKQSAS